MCDPGTTTTVPTPDWLWDERQHPENGIAIDSCVASDITAAWSQGVQTLGSCCGHGRIQPSVVLTSDPEQVRLAQQALPAFRLHQWRLVDVTRETTFTLPGPVHPDDGPLP